MILQKVGNDAHFGSELAASHQQALPPHRGDPGSRKILKERKEPPDELFFSFPPRRRCPSGPFYRRKQSSPLLKLNALFARHAASSCRVARRRPAKGPGASFPGLRTRRSARGRAIAADPWTASCSCPPCTAGLAAPRLPLLARA